MKTVRFKDPVETAEEALSRGGLDWHVSRQPVTMNGRTIPGFSAISRDTDEKVLGIVKGKYSIIQNDEAFRPFDQAIKMMGGYYSSVGSTDNGSMVFAQAELGEEEIGDDDPVKKYLTMVTRHDGGGSTVLALTPIRIVCQNTLVMVMNGKQNYWTFKIRHSGNTEQKISNIIASSVPMIQEAYQVGMDNFKLLAKTKAEAKDTKEVVGILIPKTQKMDSLDDMHTRTQARVELLQNLMFHGTGQELGSAAGTLWGLYNGVTEYYTHQYGKNDDSRFRSNFDGAAMQLKALVAAYLIKRAVERRAA